MPAVAVPPRRLHRLQFGASGWVLLECYTQHEPEGNVVSVATTSASTACKNMMLERYERMRLDDDPGL
eukprot:297417-Amphidinium_carterae.1